MTIKEPKNPLSNFKSKKYEIVASIVTCIGIKQIQSEKIAKEYIEKAIDLVLSFEKSLKVPELAKNVSRAFGFKSTSKKTSNKITLVIDSMIGKGILINTNDKIEFR